MIKKVYWYCPECDYATHDMPMSTRCLVCGNDSFLNDYQQALKYELALKLCRKTTEKDDSNLPADTVQT